MKKPTMLLIFDGWGHREEKEYNAIEQAHKPVFDHLWQTCPHTLIQGSGKCVGLPEGQMGNSEVGHLNLGLGRVVKQDFTRIEDAISTGEFFNNSVFIDTIKKTIAQNKSIHILGLLSPGGVHSHENHIHAMIKCASLHGAKKIFIHAFLDGRDTPPKSALASIQLLEKKCQEYGVGKIATLIGRYYAMDRDNRWDRVQAAYDLLTQGKTVRSAKTAEALLKMAYENDETDEFVKASKIEFNSADEGKIQDDDTIIFMNYRADRAREITAAFTQTSFTGFQRTIVPKLSAFVMLTQYDAKFNLPIAFAPVSLKNGLGEYLSSLGLKQIRMAETEKYAHVTFFFNGGIEQPFVGEDRDLTPSPKVATYDLQPEMSAPELTEKIVNVIEKNQYDCIIVNFANADMVGHTGNLAAAIKAIECLDNCLEKIVVALKKVDGELLITADHGNAEKMYDECTHQAHTAHTCQPVPLIYVGRNAKFVEQHGVLADVAPTMLYLMGLAIPKEMTGKILLQLV
jgi:2,3-bisphosphoglycerate-independent phosphoglycerate mutase